MQIHQITFTHIQTKALMVLQDINESYLRQTDRQTDTQREREREREREKERESKTCI